MSRDAADEPFSYAVTNTSGGVTNTSVQVGFVTGGVQVENYPPPRVVPQQLPAPPQPFAGRADELIALSEVLGGAAGGGRAMGIAVISGMGGVGKTWLALRWAHRHLDRFPDGQLYANLRGFDPLGEPMRPDAVVRNFLLALSVAPEGIPVDVDAQLGLFRSLVAGTRTLIVLDNAWDAAQVTPLLPGSPTCAVIVTSRNRLDSLAAVHGAHVLDVGTLSHTDASRLLTAHLGESRAGTEAEAFEELLRCCDGLPLALGVVGALARRHPAFPLSVLADELREENARLDGLQVDDLHANVRVVLSWSYHALAPTAAKLFELLGLVTEPDIGLAALTSSTDLPPSAVRAALDELEQAHLVEQPEHRRFRMHDLVRLYAADRAQSGPHGEWVDDMIARLDDCYIQTARDADRALSPHRPVPAGANSANPASSRPTDADTALRWFDEEYSCLLGALNAAVTRRNDETVWLLAWSLDTYHWRRGRIRERVACWRLALDAAVRLGRSDFIVKAHRYLGRSCARVGLHEEARTHLATALSLAEDAGMTAEQAHTHRALVSAWTDEGDDEQALRHAQHALQRYGELDNPVWVGWALNLFGWLNIRLGHPERAGEPCERALALLREHHDRDGEARTLNTLGHAARESGRHVTAVDCYQRALALYRDSGNVYDEADTLTNLALSYAAIGDTRKARQAWSEAVPLYRNQHREPAASVRQRLAALDPA